MQFKKLFEKNDNVNELQTFKVSQQTLTTFSIKKDEVKEMLKQVLVESRLQDIKDQALD